MSNITSTDAYLNTWLERLPKQTRAEEFRLLPLHEQFHRQALLTPDAVAVVDDKRSLTYEELNLRVLALGEHLRTRFNVGLDSPVGVYMEPSVNYMISLMAAMSAGGCFVTIESSFPLNKIREVVDDSQVKVILTTRAFATKLKNVDNAPTFIVDDNYDTVMALLTDLNLDAAQLEAKRIAAPRATLDNLSFVVYTSGTTGKPKGIANPHRAPVLSYQWRWSLSDYTGGDKVACNVFFIWESIRPLLRGAATYCVSDETIYNPAELTSFVERHGVTEFLFTPTLFQNVISQMSKKQIAQKLKTLRTVYFNGEVLSKEVARRAIEYLPNVRFINVYSISECHEVGAIDISKLDLNDPPTGFCPVGHPNPLTPPYILDEALNLVKDGEAGELYVSGPLLARTYLNLPEKTLERFPTSPYTQDYVEGGDNRMYRTGDRARMLPNGMIEILGRCAFMVKIRGYSVVPGAIEVALLDAVNLEACAVIADGAEGTEKRLVAFLVRKTTGKVTDAVPLTEEGSPKLAAFNINKTTGACNDIRTIMKARLAHYMVPSVYIEVDQLPLNITSGKLNVKALNAIAEKQRKAISNPNVTDRQHRVDDNKRLDMLKMSYQYMKIPDDASLETVEYALLMAWEGILALPFGAITREDEFLALGGHSLSAARLVNTIESMFEVKLPVSQILQGIKVKHQARDIVRALDIKCGRRKVAPVKKGAAQLLQKVMDSATIPTLSATMVNNYMSESKTTKVVPDLNKCKQVFLTGATGFFGAHLLFELLMAGVEKVVCLVRDRGSDRAGKKVLVENLRSYGLLRQLGNTGVDRIVAITGDLTKVGFGVNSLSYEEVLMKSDGIIHCAAFVSLVETFENLVSSNVQGTKEMVKLAAAIKSETGVSPRGVYISTNGIFPLKRLNMKDFQRVSVENCNFNNLPSAMIYGYNGSKETDAISSMCNGYGLSKWAAEKIVTDSSEAFGLAFSTFRMGNLSPNSKTGHSNPLDFQCMIIRGCDKVGAVPVVPEWRIEGTPADIAARNVVSLSSTHQTGNKISHIVQPNHTPWSQVVAWMDEVRLERKLPKLKQIAWDEWRNVVKDIAKTSVSTTKLLGLIDLLPNGGVEYLSCQPYLECSKTCMDSDDIDKYNISTASLKLFLNRLKMQKMFSIKTKKVGNSGGSTEVKTASIAQTIRSLEGKVAIVTGASSGIGRGIVVELARAGCNVALAARRLEQLEISRKLMSEACSNGTVETVCIPTDVTDREAMINCVAITEETLGPVDIIVNCAGVMYFEMMKNVHWDDWERTVNVNCKGPMYGIGAVLPQMIARGKGHIINITSDAGVTAFAGLGIYSGSKFFVEGMSKALRLETASTGIRVTCIQPGNVNTPLLATSTDQEGIKMYGEPSGAKVLEPADIGRAVVYAATQPEWCAINDILVEPREEPT